MKKLKVSATFTAVLGFFAVLALVFLYLSLSDIAKKEPDLKLEWFITDICYVVLSAFTLSTLITLGYLLRSFDRIIKLTTDRSGLK
jgi:hypothetical protein